MPAKLPEPRWQTPLPEGVAGSWGPLVELYARTVLHIQLDRWQRKALNRALVYDADYRLLHRLYLCSTARQQGKTAIVRSLIGTALTERYGPDWSRILGLAYDRGQARIPYEAVMEDLRPLAHRYGPEQRGGLSVTRYLGIRSRMHGRAREYHTGSREARDSIRGMTTDLAVFDEIRTQRDYATWAALEPTTTARPEPLIFAISTAGDDRSVLLRDWWERGRRIIDGAEPMRDFGMTWYAAPDDIPPDDPRAWRAANPAVAEGRIPLSAIASAVGTSGGADTVMFRSERLNLWAEASDEWLPAGLWAQQIGPRPDAGRAVFAIETTQSWRHATIALALPAGEGAWAGIAGAVDAARLEGSPASVPPDVLIAELDRLYGLWKPAAVAYISTAAIAPYVEAWAGPRDITAVAMGPKDLRSASELFRSELIGGRLTHSDDPLLSLQVRTVRPSSPIEGGNWYLSQRDSPGEVDAIRSVAWASWAAIAPVDAGIPVQIFV